MEQLTQTISNLVGIMLGLVGVVGVAYFIFGAFQYLTASGAPNQMEKGKSAMMTAVAGIVLAMVAFGVVDVVMNAVVSPVVEVDLPDPATPPGLVGRHIQIVGVNQRDIRHRDGDGDALVLVDGGVESDDGDLRVDNLNAERD